MASNVSTLALLAAVLGLSACTTPSKPIDDGAVRQECECKCAYSALQGGVTPGERIGTFTFPSDGPTCSYTAVDNYVPCKDAQGETHAGTRYSDCKFMGVAPPQP
jgi:hypothetical protein